MAGEDINPNVVLTADTSQYDRSMQASAAQTDLLVSSLDKVGSTLDRLSKSAGKKLIGIAAADVAAITAATAAYAAYEKQMSSLQAQAAILGRTTETQTRNFATYERSVASLRQTFGTTVQEAAALTQQLSKVTDRTQSIDRLSNTFVKMSNATGEATTGLATSVTNLQRVMGTPQRDTAAYADQLTTLAAGANTSATALADFSSQLAPLGRMVGMSQTDITGIATAFTKAGQDGFQAANVFSKMVSDIAYATQTGSPELSKYSNLIGVTMEQFKDMSGTEQVVKIFDQLNRLGPRAITELNQLGYDGMRTMRAITAMSNQSGGIGTSIQKARAAFGDGSVDRGSKAAMTGMYDEFQKMRSEIAMTAESVGATFAPAVTKMMEVVEKLTSGFRALMEGPFGSFIKGIAAVVAPVAAVSGTLLTMAATLTKVAAAALLVRGAVGVGFSNARQGGGLLETRGPLGMMANMGGTMAGPVNDRGRMIRDRGSWVQRGGYNLGALAGGLIGTAGGGPGMLARGAGLGMRGVGAGANLLGDMLYSPLTMRGMADPTQRARMFTSPTMMGSMRGAAGTIGDLGWTAAARAGGAGQMQQQQTQQMGRLAQAYQRLDTGVRATEKELGPLRRGFAGATTGITGLLSTLGSAGVGAAKWGAQGGMALGRAALPMMGAMAMSPLGMLGIGVGGMMLYDKFRDKTTAEFTDVSGSGNAYRAAGGLSNNPAWSPSLEDPDPQVTMQQAMTIDQDDVLAATRESHKLTNKGLYGMSEEETVAYLGTQWDTYKNNAQSRQAVVLDLIDKFDQETAQSIIGRLDAGEMGGIQSWNLDDFGGEDKKGIGDRVSGALGLAEDRASGVFSSMGSEASQAARGTAFAQIFGDVLKGGGNSRDEAFAVLERELFGGETNFSEDDIRQLTQNKVNIPGKGSRYTTDRDMADIMGSDLSNPMNASIFTARMLTRGVSTGAEGAEEGARSYLNELGVKNVEDIDVSKFNEVNEALLGVLTAKGQAEQDDPNSLTNRLKGLGGVGEMVANSSALERAYMNQGDIEAQYKAIDSVYSQMTASGKNMLTVYTDLGNAQAEVGNTGDHMYQMLDAVRSRIVGDERMSQGLMTRPQVYQSEANILGASLADDSPLNADQKAAATDQFIQTTMEQAQYFKQMLLQQRQFELSIARAQEDFAISRERMEEQYNLSRSRAQDDFNLQRKYQEQDYQLSRRRAESDFELSQKRSVQAYDRSMRRSRADFQLSRRRQEEDYQHQVEQNIKAQAQQMYNVYERITVQRTSSTNYVALNLRDQVEAMQKQANDLDSIRGLGLSDEAIQQMGLGKTENAQQLSRMLEDLQANPQQVAELNTLIQQQLAAAGELVTDESSNEWAEWERSYELSRDRAMEDFRKAVRRGRKDFNVQMNQMEDDFAKSMSRQAEDYEKAQDRQQKAFSKSMQRSAEDYETAVDNMTSDFGRSMARAQEDMDLLNQNVAGNLKEILIAATTELSGETQKQAQLVLDTFTNLDKTLGDEGVSIMQRMAAIFGFDYTPPKNPGKGGGKGNNGQNSTDDTPQGFGSGSFAEGGVLPGRSIGKDNMHFYSPHHGSLSLAGGEAIMVPEWVDKVGGPEAVKRMNTKARQGYASGGVIPAPGAWNQHTSGYPWARWSGDINIPGASDYGNPVKAWKDGVVADAQKLKTSYGWHIRMNHPGTDESTLYAHLSQILVDIGDTVKAGTKIGEVGSTGNSSGPHLHFEIMGGQGPIGLPGSDDSRGGAKLRDVLKDFYAPVEEAASMVKLGGGMFPEGHMSGQLNKFARKTWRKLAKGGIPDFTEKGVKWHAAGGIATSPQVIGVGEAGAEAILPLDGRGAAFINDIMMRSQVGSEAKSTHLTGNQPVGSVTHQNVSIDRSTTFSGAITVQANNPAEFLSQMKQRQRVMALSQPVLGGSRV